MNSRQKKKIIKNSVVSIDLCWIPTGMEVVKWINLLQTTGVAIVDMTAFYRRTGKQDPPPGYQPFKVYHRSGRRFRVIKIRKP